MLRKFTQSIYEGVFKRIGSYDRNEKTKLKKKNTMIDMQIRAN